MDPICILAAGIGSRLGKLTEHLPKCLLPLGQVAAITRIVEQFPAGSEFIVAVGYRGKMVMSYLQLAHPEMRFTYVPVSNYDQPGSGPGHSLQCCKHLLQRPFHLVCSDSLVEIHRPEPTHDYLLLADLYATSPTQYSTAALADDLEHIASFKNKDKVNFHPYAFTGWAFIHEYETFWQALEEDTQEDEKEFIQAWYDPARYRDLRGHVVDRFYDIGSVRGYEEARCHFHGAGLGMDKVIKEMTYRVGDRIIKIAGQEDTFCRRERSYYLPNTPEIIEEPLGERGIAYQWIPGKTLYQILSPELVETFLSWCQVNLWDHRPEETWYELSGAFQQPCQEFYTERTNARVETYLTDQKRGDPTQINGNHYPPITSLLRRAPWETLIEGRPSLFHGDLQFDNVLQDETGKFRLIDWRIEFNGGADLRYGDTYYDLAKMYGGILLNYRLIKKGWHDVYWDSSTSVQIHCSQAPEQAQAQQVFERWVQEHGYDLRKIRFLTALVWLNMSPLHPGKVGELFFCWGKSYLASLL